MSDNARGSITRRRIFLALLVGVSFCLALLALVIPILSNYLTPALDVGQVAARDYRAPNAISYESDVLTEQRRELAERAVAPIYTSPNTSVARQQLERLRTALAYISSVRADTYAMPNQKVDDLSALDDIDLSQETATTILALTDARWQAIQQEAIAVLERVMSGVIRPDTVSGAYDRLPAMVSLSLPEGQAAIVAELAAAFIEPNSQFSENLTEAAKQEARDSVTPVQRTFVPEQTVVSRGDVLTEADIEALREMGLAQPEQRWQDVVSAISLASLLLVFMLIYLQRKEELLSGDMRSLALITVLFLSFLLGARLAIPAHTVIPYLIPVAAYSLTIASLFGAGLAMVSSLPLAVMVAYGLPYALDLTLYYLLGSLFGILALGRARRLISFFWAGAAIAFSGAVIVVVYRLPLPTTDAVGLATLAGAALFNGLASASIAIVLQFLLALFLGLTTPIQLSDLTRPDHPLLQGLLHDAPGTYQHSLQVANLAEQAAEQVGADPLLTRVGALYHDIGKTLNPFFFIENQPTGFLNPHDSLDPVDSASIIIRHVEDGLQMGRKHRLPRRIIDFIAEHHGDMLTRYQYFQAVKAAGGDESQVDKDLFRYPGPRPQSRETGILMLADSSEARVRAERPMDVETLNNMIKEVIDNRVSVGQLDDTGLTLRDLSKIRRTFTTTLRGIYHPRIEYPRFDTTSSREVPTKPVSGSADVQVDLPVDVS